MDLTISNIKAYVEGNLSYMLYYSPFKFLIKRYIKEQIDWRIAIMNIECYNNGTCVMCGCRTTALQMATKPCDGDCYPPLYSKKYWDRLKCVLTKAQRENPESFKEYCKNTNRKYHEAERIGWDKYWWE